MVSVVDGESGDAKEKEPCHGYCGGKVKELL